MTDLQEHGQIDDGGSIENLHYFPLWKNTLSFVYFWLTARFINCSLLCVNVKKFGYFYIMLF